MRTIDTICLHHSVTDPNNKDIWAVSVEGHDYVPGFYIDGKEYKGNYHVLIYQDGERKYPVPVDRYTYHCGVYNINLTSLAICFIGNFEENKPSKESLQAAKKTIEEMKEIYDIKNIYHHRDVYETACPGKYISLDKIMEVETMLSKQQVDRAFMSILKHHVSDSDYPIYMNAKNEIELLHLVANSIEHNEIYNDAMRMRKGFEEVNEKLFKVKK